MVFSQSFGVTFDGVEVFALMIFIRAYDFEILTIRRFDNATSVRWEGLHVDEMDSKLS